MNILDLPIDSLVSLRKSIHLEPELSGMESMTVKKINDFIRIYSPDKTIQEIGKSGIAYIFRGYRPGPTLLLRAELDALPIDENIKSQHNSLFKNISHKCGHDGHIAILCGVASCLNSCRPEKGRVVLLFQPAEETGQGANLVINDSRFNEIQPDYVFALHNIPGYPAGSILIRNDVFAMASRGLRIILGGKSSHASEPEKGKNPLKAFTSIIENIEKLPLENQMKDGMITICHAKLGEYSFGLCPGNAEILATIRSKDDNDMETLSNITLDFIGNVCLQHNLNFDYSWREEFPATVNDSDCVNYIHSAAGETGNEVVFLSKPFKWSEDFGTFTSQFKGAFFGIGAGTEISALHHPEYDFPDNIISQGVSVYLKLISKILS